MTVLITGGSGKLGKELVKIFKNSLAPRRDELDITDRESTFEFIKNKLPDVIIHTAAFTDVRRAESERGLAWKTNVTGTEDLVDACLKHNPKTYFVYISTACVFDGQSGMYNEESVPGPKNFYSLTKLVGEFVVKKLDNYLIIRTNFVAREKWPYPKAFTDRFGTYLFADDLAKAIEDIVDSRQRGIIHITGDEKMSMFELARITTPDVEPMTLKEYKGPPVTIDMSLDTIRWKKYKISV
jgi:dTDP-4-dehydrorhamnose reductase